MSEDKKRNLRTQGKYLNESEGSRHFKEKRQSFPNNNVREHFGKERHTEKRSQNEKNSSHSLSYTENSSFAFTELQERKKPKELIDTGWLELSESQNGKSRIFYKPEFLHPNERPELLNIFINTTTWNTKNIVIRGLEYPQPRLVAWYGPFPYSYSGVILEAAEMPPKVKQIKNSIEQHLQQEGMDVKFNSVLLNYYRNGKDSVAWHSDDELSMGICPTIASVSLGAVRKFEMKCKDHISEENYQHGDFLFLNLKNGSLLIMDGCMQKDWQHRVPKEFHDKSARINLTFRTVYSLERPQLNRFYMNNISKPVARNAHVLKDEDNPFSRSDRDDVCNNVPVLNNTDFPSLNDSMDSKYEVAEKKFNIDVSKATVVSEKKFHGTTPVAANSSSNFLDISLEETKDHIQQNKDNNFFKSEYFDKKFASCETDMSSIENLANTCQPTILSPNNLSDSGKCVYKHSVSYDMTNEDSFNLTQSSENEEPEPTKKWQLNINAPQFIPKKNNYSLRFSEEKEPRSLEELVEITYSELHNDVLKYFSFKLKDEILKNIHKLRFVFRDELQFLCNITNEEQSENNQKLISERICKVYKSSKERLDPNYQGSSYSNYRDNKAQYGSRNRNFRRH